MKLLAFDLETGGLDPKRHAILQLGGIFCEENGTEIERFNWLVRPFEMDQVDDKALQVNRIDRSDFETEKFLSPQEIYRKFKGMLTKYINPYNRRDKLHLVGYNCHSFDCQFLREFFRKNGDKYYGSYFWTPPLDMMLIYSGILAKSREHLPDFKLCTVATTIGIELDPDKLHDAIYDVEVTLELYRRWYGKNNSAS